MKPIYKSLALAAMTLQVSLALNAQTRDDERASTMALPADLLDSLRVELVALNVSGTRNLIESGECVIDGSNLTITLDTSEWTRGAMYRLQVLATFGTQTQVIYALNITVPYYIALSDTPQEYEDDVTIVLTITDVTEADLEGLALEATSQEIKAAITPIAGAAEAYNVGKMQLAAAITSKGVETSPTETYPEMAEKVNTISQETYEINGGEMYAKQLFGSLTTPNYWNLYEVLAQLLSDGRLVNYGGILLAEYYKGYDSLALSGAGAGGAYVVSDKDSDGNFIMYTNDTTHTWDTEDDGKCDRWVAYCFANEGHDFEITNTNTSPRKIHIGRKVGNLVFLANSRTSEVVITDGAELADISQGNYTCEWAKQIIIRGLKNHTNKISTGSSEQVFIKVAGKISNLYGGSIVVQNSCNTVFIEANEIEGGSRSNSYYITNIPTGIVRISTLKLTNMIVSRCKMAYFYGLEECTFSTGVGQTISGDVDNPTEYIYIGYSTNDKAKRVDFAYGQNNEIDIELQEGYCKSIGLYHYSIGDAPNLTEVNMYAHILQKLKQDEPDCGDGVTITLGATNLAKLTSAESVQLLDDLTNIYGYTFA